MSKVITFSRFFPSYHPRKGKPTFFVEKILNSVYNPKSIHDIPFEVQQIINQLVLLDREEKHHTIRFGHRWKAGDKFSPRVWSDKPYRSKQITFAPDIEIKKVWDIHFDEGGVIDINGFYTEVEYETIATNDGLSFKDFHFWFPIGKPFTGQIICWNENIEY